MKKDDSIVRFDHTKFSKLRISKGITLEGLANQLDVSVSTVWTMENVPGRIMSTELMLKYCLFFEVTLLELLSPDCAKQYAKSLASFLETHGVIDEGSAKSITNFYCA